jgi:large subunit ribosomal protein L5
VGLGKLRNQANFEDKLLKEVEKELALITGQKPAIRRAKKSIAGFKIRSGDIVGLQVTLRGKRLADFFVRLISIVLPRVKDFKGIDLHQIDQNGNLNICLKEQFVFPEIQADQSKVNFGLQITIVLKPEYRKKAVALYRDLGVPLKKN